MQLMITRLISRTGFWLRKFFVTRWNSMPFRPGLLWTRLSLIVHKFGWFLEARLFRYKRKALLIGINDKLAGPHRDVRALQQLLIDLYGYKDEDIVVMLDGGVEDPQLEPTSANIRREIQNLVKGAQPGDRLLFLFSGHSEQVVNERRTEDDGKDECVIASDGINLIDNKLKQYLVDPLPAGCSLVAIFDTCHSATLLDLKHHRCNRIYVPWVSKALSIRLSGQQLSVSPIQETEQQEPEQEPGPSSFARSGKPPSSNDRVLSESAEQLLSVHTSIDETWISQSLQASPTQETKQLDPGQESGSSSISSSPIRRCSSPRPQLQCDGFKLCESVVKDAVAYVIALGACKDAQVAWEDNGDSLTAILVDILKKDPHPRLREMMVVINHRTYATVCRLHEIWKEWQIEYNKQGKHRLTEDEDTQTYRTIERENPLKVFQDPQLASHTRLNMNSFFTL